MEQPQTHCNAKYYPVHPAKFIFLSLITFDLYILYWCYKCWKYIKVQESTRIMPFWRAFFVPLWTFALATRILGPDKNWLSAFLFIGFFVTQAIWRADDPVSYLSMFAFVFYLPLVKQVNRLNADAMPVTYTRFRWQHILVSVGFLPLFLFTTTTILNITPSNQVVPGYMVYPWQKQVLREMGGLNPNETLLYFYSTAMHMKYEGNYLTDQRVVSYWTDEQTDEVAGEFATYADIDEVRVERPTGFLEDSTVTIVRHDGSGFYVVLSTENNRDREFLKELENRRKAAHRRHNPVTKDTGI